MNTKLQKKIPTEFIIQIKKIDLLSYLKRYEPNTLIKDKNHYRSIIHDGLVIYKNRWIWKDGKMSGISAIQYLVFVEKFDFYDALYLLFRCYEKELHDGKKIYQ